MKPERRRIPVRVPGRLPPVLDGITTYQQILKRLSSQFLPASASQPPGADPTATGGRIVVKTTQNDPQVGIRTAMVSGVASWNFPVEFVNLPVVSYGVEGNGGSANLYIESLTRVSITIASTSTADTRMVHINVQGDPN